MANTDLVLVQDAGYADAVRRLNSLGLGFVVTEGPVCTDFQTGGHYPMVNVERMGPRASHHAYQYRGPISDHFGFGNQLFFVEWVERVEAWLADEQIAEAA